MAKGWTRRKRLIARTATVCASLALVAAGTVLLKRPPEKYVPGERMAGLTETLSRPVPPDYPRVTFVDVSKEAGVDFRHFHGARSMQLPEDMGSGAAWGDYDGDGWLDLYVVNEAGPLTMTPQEVAASPAHNALYRNNGDSGVGRSGESTAGWTFADVTAKAGVGHRGCGMGAAWGDYDNDGRPDLFVTNYGENVLYRNNGDGTFTDVSKAAGVAGTKGFWTGAAWGDYNRDGFLDLYVCGYVQYRYDPANIRAKTQQYASLVPASLNPSTYRPERNLLYRNDGDGTFTEVARSAGVENMAGRSLSASWGDFDGDGWPDLYVANDVSDNAMFRNRGDGTFEDVSHSAHVADYRGAMGLAVGDWDGDEDLDIFITHWIAQENALYNNLKAEFAQTGQAGKGMRFVDVADRFGLGQVALDYVGWGAAFADYDNDGRPDLFVVDGSTFQREDDPSLLVPMRGLLFWNRGPQEGFFEVGAVSGEVFQREVVGRGLAVGDYDNDGDPDAFVVVNGGAGMLLRNDGSTGLTTGGGDRNRWLKVRLVGGATSPTPITPSLSAGGEGGGKKGLSPLWGEGEVRLSNRNGIGAKVRVVIGEKGYLREVGAGASYCSQNAVGEELFGLGQAERVTALEVTWPGGATQRLTDLAVNQTVVVKEPISSHVSK